MAEAVEKIEQETPLEKFRRSAGFQIMFVLYSGLETGRAIDHLCASAEKFAAASREWQPIETAPDNEIALFWVVPDDPTFDGGSFLNMKPQIFWGKNRCWSSLLHATHWMPLPDPPETNK